MFLYLLRYPKSILFAYVVLAAAILASVLIQGSRHIRSEVAVAMASTYADSITTFREYYSSVVVTRANQSGVMASHRYLEETDSIPNPATLAIELGRELSSRRLETGFRFYSDYPFVTREDGGPRDEFERTALEALSKGGEGSYTQLTTIDQKDVLRHAVPVTMTESCVACHNSHEDSPKTDWQVGDIRGVQSVALFLPPIDPFGNSGYYLMLLGSVGAILCVLGFLYLKVQRFVRDEQRLADRQEAEKHILAKEKQAAEEANASKTVFLSNVSHELRTPLNAIIGFSEMIKTQALGTIDKPRYIEYASDIHQSGQHLLALINDLLDMNRIEAGEFELHKQDLDVDKLTVECCDLIRGEAEKAGVALKREVDPNLPPIESDPRVIKQIILNMLSNAVKFTPADGLVTLRISCDESNQLVIEVKDTGIGIAREDLEKIMKPFGQIRNGLSSKYRGSGLGLPLIAEFTKLLGGDFQLQSEPGLGTEVKISLASSAVAN
ncbi:ATP-binding protein [Denitrobaculum tricleocarpae]|uniref:ATP-binding protein n=1 Tax=Denitrobaculum tricleocarpae TaxID=2591009 RepID=UPI0015D43EC9|nr:ATP-binding protein [Denitrobaculum tricleocarpae]